MKRPGRHGLNQGIQPLGPHNPFPELGPVQGIYAIFDTGTPDEPFNAGWMYVGQSTDCHARAAKHDVDLRRGTHHCWELQATCTGVDGLRWRVFLLEEVEEAHRLTDREAFWRRRAVKCFNPA